MTCHDRYGLPLSTASDEAEARYREGIDCVLAAWPGAGEAFDAAIAVDRDFALAHIARARAFLLCRSAGRARVCRQGA